MVVSSDGISRYRCLRLVVAVLAIGFLGACSTTTPLMPTPHLYAGNHAQLFEDLAPELQTNTIPLFFVTDRAPETSNDNALRYGYERSKSLAYGQAIVTLEGAATWPALVAASTQRQREQQITIELTDVREIGRTPPTPFAFTARGGFYDYDPRLLAEVAQVAKHFDAEINRRLDLTPRKEVLLFIHGYNNTFRDAALTLAGLWHFFGREGVPVLYSWPAGRGGLTGYAYDRESGEFTVHHLKMMIRALARNPQIEGLRIVAHSRGTDVLTSSLRELFIESRAAGEDPLEVYRIRQLILAAPDLDFDVTLQRLVSEPLSPGVGHVSVYVSPTDKAIGFAEWLFGSVKRIGRMHLRDLIAPLSGKQKTRPYAAADNSSVIELSGSGGDFGHSYFYDNPAVSSDVLLTLRFDRLPGTEHGRPLTSQGRNFWLIEDQYLLPEINPPRKALR